MGKFKEGENVFVWDRGQIFESKIVEARNDDQEYLVHFMGWAKRWDTWKPLDAIEKRTPKFEEIFAQQQAALKAKKVTGKKRAKSNTSGKSSSNTKVKQRKVAASSDSSTSRAVIPTVVKIELKGGEKKRIDDVLKNGPWGNLDVCIHVPKAVHKHLVCDYTNIIQEKQLLRLPRQVSVADILQQWVQERIRQGDTQQHVNEVHEALTAFFDRVLQRNLLYSFEKPQHEEQSSLKNYTKPSAWYGATHLLRMLVRLPEWLGCITLSSTEKFLLQLRVNDLLQHVSRRRKQYFPESSDYVHTDLQYHARVSAASARGRTKK